MQINTAPSFTSCGSGWISGSFWGEASGNTLFQEFSCSTMMRMLFQEEKTTKATMKPVVKTYFGSVLFADISGFTRASASLSQDELCRYINTYFTQILNIIGEHNGDVVKFCGDALMIVWPVPTSASKGTKEATVKLATACAGKLLSDSVSWAELMEPSSPSANTLLGLHCGVACGELHCMCVGEGERWEFLVTGDVITRVGHACGEAENGELCLSKDAYEMMENSVSGVKVQKHCFKIEKRNSGTLSVEPNGKKGIAERDQPRAHSAVDALAMDSNMDLGTDSPTFAPPLSPTGPRSSRNPRNLTVNTFRGSGALKRSSSGLPHSPLSSPSRTPENSPHPRFVSLDDVKSQGSSRFSFFPSNSGGDPGNGSPVLSPTKSFVQRISPKSETSRHRRDSRGSGNSGDLLPEVSPPSCSTGFFENDDRGLMMDVKRYLVQSFAREGLMSPKENPGMADVLKCYVHESARESIQTGTTALMGELRVVVTMFIEVIGLRKDFNRGSIRRPQKVMRFMLTCLRHFGGALRQYIVDDKGCVLIAGFGLPGFSHVDNCARAVETAVALRRLLQASQLDCKIGISEGRVYCGLVGSSERCEYSMMGASVNLAARMMGKCKLGQISVNETVYHRTSENFEYSVLPKIKTKGYKMPISVFCPTDRVNLGSGIPVHEEDNGHSGSRKVDAFIGRERELSIFDSALESFCKTSDSSSHLIEAEIGIGKSWLVGEVCYMASQRLGIGNLYVVEAQSPESYRANRYESARQLLRQIFCFRSGGGSFDPSEFVTPATSHKTDERAEVADVPDRLVSSPIDINYTAPVPRIKMLQYMTSKSSRSSLNSTFSDSSNELDDRSPRDKMSQDTERAFQILGVKQRKKEVENAIRLTLSKSPVQTETPESLIMIWVDDHVTDDDTLAVTCSDYPDVKSDLSTCRTKDTMQDSNSFDSLKSGGSGVSDVVSQSDASMSSVTFPSKPPTTSGTRIKVLNVLSLLNDFLNIKIPVKNEVTKLSKSQKEHVLNALLIFIITRTVQKAKTLLVLEHLQWCDPFSFYILTESMKQCKENLFFIGTKRSTVVVKESRELSLKRETKMLAELIYVCEPHALRPFTLDEIRSTLETALEPIVSMTNPEITSKHNLSTISERTDGSPLLVCCLCFEISEAIKFGSFVDIASLPCGRRDNLIDLFDLLSHSDQTVLKVAAVIGRSFTMQELCYLLAMMGLSACLVDLRDALRRMMETSFIEEQIDVPTPLERMKSTSGCDIDEESVARYYFTNNSVHENVYNLLLEEHREAAHTFLGSYLEAGLTNKPTLFDRTMFHFVRSSNMSKKVEYLCKAAEVSRIKGRFRDVYFYFGELVKLSTGLHINDLLVFSCYSDELVHGATESAPHWSVLSRGVVARRTAEFPIGTFMNRQWITGGDIKRPIYSLFEDISIENVCRWIGEMGIIMFKLGALRSGSNFMILSLHGLNIIVPEVPELVRKSLGKGNIGVSDSWFSSFSRRVRGDDKSRDILTGPLPENIMALKLARSLLEYLSMTYLLHGATTTVPSLMNVCSRINLKIRDTGATRRNDGGFFSPTGFVDRIVDPDCSISDMVHEEEKNGISTQSDLTLLGMSLSCVVNRTKGVKPFAISHSRSFDEADIVNTTQHLPSETFLRLENKASSVQSLSAISYVESAAATHYFSATSSDRADFATYDYAIVNCETANFNASKGKFKECLRYLDNGIRLLTCMSDESGGTMQRYVYLFKNWVSFVCGRNAKFFLRLDEISKFVAVFEQVTLYKWALELRSLHLVLNSLRGKACSSISDILRKLREIRKSDNPSASTSAVIALAYALDNNPIQAVTYAKYSLQKLVQRDCVTFVRPLFIFIAGYAAAIAMELYAAAMIDTSDHECVPDTQGKHYTPLDWFLEANRKSSKAARRYELAKECVSMAQQRLRVVYKTSQPCVVTLYRALKIKHSVCDAVRTNKVRKLPYKNMVCTIKTDGFNEFVFGNVFLKLEQLNLKVLFEDETRDTVNMTETACNVAIDAICAMFSSMGCKVPNLDNFGLFRFTPSNLDALELLSLPASTEGSENALVGPSLASPESKDNYDRISRIVKQYQAVNITEYQEKVR